jgi:pseudouridine synthase, RluA family
VERFCLRWLIRPEEGGKKIQYFLRDHAISRKALRNLLNEGGAILLNGQAAHLRDTLSPGDELKLVFPVERMSENLVPEELPLEVLYEDEVLLVVNKPAGMSTIPSRDQRSGTLANALAGYFKKKSLRCGCHIVTRLDRYTSGICVVAKYRHIHHLFSTAADRIRVVREYEAFVEGIFRQEKGRVDAPIARKPDSIIERMVAEGGKTARTRFERIAVYPEFSHIRLWPETGRTHQIRVHMAYLGYPLVGDDLYGGSKNLLSRQALHCGKVSFKHPITDETIVVRAKLPDDMSELIASQEKAGNRLAGDGE